MPGVRLLDRATLLDDRLESRSNTGGGYPSVFGAIAGTEKRPIAFHPVADDPAPALGAAHRGKRLDGTLKAVKGVPLPIMNELEALIVLSSTEFTYAHDWSPPLVFPSQKFYRNAVRRT